VLVSAATTSGAEARVWVSVSRLGGSASTWLGLLAARDVSCDIGDLDVDPARIHWVYVNLVTGEYRMRYLDGSTSRDASGRARLLYDTNVLNLSAMSWDERYSLGPVVAFINPTRASQAYTVTVITIQGYRIVFYLTPLPGAPEGVAVDMVLLWEDLWWPGTPASLDNYVDHAVRVTVFTNDTLRVEILRASGCYLHMLLYRPGGLPGFDSIPGLAREYQASGHRLPAGSGVVYVKSHGAWVPASDMDGRIWDPERGVWLRSWPIVFLVHP